MISYKAIVQIIIVYFNSLQWLIIWFLPNLLQWKTQYPTKKKKKQKRKIIKYKYNSTSTSL